MRTHKLVYLDSQLAQPVDSTPEGEYTQTSFQQKTLDSTTCCGYVATSIKHLTVQRKLRCHGSTAGVSKHSAVVDSCTTATVWSKEGL